MVSTVIVPIAEESAVHTPPWGGERRSHSHSCDERIHTLVPGVWPLVPVLISPHVSGLTENDTDSSPSPPPTEFSATVLKALRRDYLELSVKVKAGEGKGRERQCV